MTFFHGEGKRGPYFEGWYFKHQSPEGRTLALIPAFHVDAAGDAGASIQIIGDTGSWWLEYPDTAFWAAKDRFRVRVGDSYFGASGIELEIERDGLSLKGSLRYGPFSCIASDIMGPFRLFGGMQCAHGVLSMRHSLHGRLVLNGEQYDFSNGVGYIETDRGRSFPDKYLWTQCIWQGSEMGSLMLAVASIPLPVGGFTGCICAIQHQGREYRLATYRGARIEAWSARGAVIRQGQYRLAVELLEGRGQPLHAPVEGSMERFIHESLCAKVRYTFQCGNRLLFRHTDPRASFEYSSKEEVDNEAVL